MRDAARHLPHGGGLRAPFQRLEEHEEPGAEPSRRRHLHPVHDHQDQRPRRRGKAAAPGPHAGQRAVGEARGRHRERHEEEASAPHGHDGDPGAEHLGEHPEENTGNKQQAAAGGFRAL